MLKSDGGRAMRVPTFCGGRALSFLRFMVSVCFYSIYPVCSGRALHVLTFICIIIDVYDYYAKKRLWRCILFDVADHYYFLIIVSELEIDISGIRCYSQRKIMLL